MFPVMCDIGIVNGAGTAGGSAMAASELPKALGVPVVSGELGSGSA